MDESYVQEAGIAVAHFWRAGRASELAYTPGNGTLYELVFSPLGLTMPASAADWMDDQRRRSVKTDRPELDEVDSTWMLLSWIGHGAWPFDLRAFPSKHYLREKFAACTIGDAEALCALLEQVARATNLYPVPVTS